MRWWWHPLLQFIGKFFLVWEGRDKSDFDNIRKVVVTFYRWRMRAYFVVFHYQIFEKLNQLWSSVFHYGLNKEENPILHVCEKPLFINLICNKNNNTKISQWRQRWCILIECKMDSGSHIRNSFSRWSLFKYMKRRLWNIRVTTISSLKWVTSIGFFFNCILENVVIKWYYSKWIVYLSASRGMPSMLYV